MSKVVLDASAVLAYLNDEPGGDLVVQPLETGNVVISAVNVAEVAARMVLLGATPKIATSIVQGLAMEVVALDESLAFVSASLISKTKPHGLSLGDRCCIALGQHLGLPVMTADRVWAEIDFGVDMQVIR